MEAKLNLSMDQLKREIQMAETIEQCLQTERERLYIEKLRLTEKLEELIEDKNILAHLPDTVSQEKYLFHLHGFTLWKEVKDLLEDIRNDEIHLLELKHRKRLASIAQDEEILFREIRQFSGLQFNDDVNKTILSTWFHQLNSQSSKNVLVQNINFRQNRIKDGKVLQDELSFSLQYAGIVIHIEIKTENEYESTSYAVSKESSFCWQMVTCSFTSDFANHEISARGRQVIQAQGSVSIFIQEICNLLDREYLDAK